MKVKTKKILSLMFVFLFALGLFPTNHVAKAAPVEIETKAKSNLKRQVQDKLSDSDTISIIVKLKEPTAEPNYSLKDEMSKKARIEDSGKKQRDLKMKMSKLGINMSNGYDYHLLFNGFSGRTTYAEALKIAELPEVELVEYDVQFNAPELIKPAMSVSAPTVGANTAWDLGYKGEGRLIAILDSGADHNHPDFKISDDSLAMYKSSTEANNKILQLGLKGKYFSQKIVYGYNYFEGSTRILEDSIDGQHGMHVAGTTAANGDPANGGVRGIAPEAQLLVMRVFNEGTGTGESIYAKAMEDSLNLGADTINMSLGSPAGTIYHIGDLTTVAVENAMALGVVVNMAVGNEGWFGEGYTNPLAENIDYGIAGTPSTSPNALSVASVDNLLTSTKDYVLLSDGTKLINSAAGLNWVNFWTRDGESFVDGKHGTLEELSSINVTGKAVLVELSNTISKIDQAKNVADKGGTMTIFYEPAYNGDVLPEFYIKEITTDAITVIRSQALALIANPNVTFTTTTGKIEVKPTGEMSSFSNWGMSNEGDLKPEITAPGGGIYSTQNVSFQGATGDYGYDYMSGTSMATPHVAGGTTIVRQRLSKDLPNLKGNDQFKFIKNLLMSTATPHVDPATNVFTSPRKQGAGVMNLSAATQGYVVAVDTVNGFSKLVLGNVGNQFMLNITLENLGSKAETFNYKGTLQTDLIDGRFVTLRPRLLGQLPTGSVTVPAGGTVDISIPVDAAAFEADLSAQMPNGYFLEGFVVFESTSGTPDISIPYVGFKGVWNDLRVLEKSIYDFNFPTEKPMYYGSDLNDMINYTHFESTLSGNAQVLGNYPLNTKVYDKEHIVISPNGDGKIDDAQFVGTFLRAYANFLMSVRTPGSSVNLWDSWDLSNDAFGKENNYSGYKDIGMATTSLDWLFTGKDNSGDKIADGVYELNIDVSPWIDGAPNQNYKYKLYIDTVKPTLPTIKHLTTNNSLILEPKDENSGVYTVVVKDELGNEIKANADGSYTIAAGGDPSKYTATVTDYGYNTATFPLTPTMVVGANVVSVENPAVITVPYGTAYDTVTMPKTVKTTLSDGKIVDIPVIWETTPVYDANKPGTYTVNGTLDLNGLNYSNTNNVKAAQQITVLPRTITDIPASDTIVVKKGTPSTDLTLPTEVTVKLSDGTTANYPVKWDISNYDPNLVGNQQFSGVVTLPADGTVTNPDNKVASIIISVEPIPLKITAVAAQTTITKPQGTFASSLGLPNEAEVTLEDGTKTMLPVTWDTASYDLNLVGTQTLSATLTLPTNGMILNPDNLKATIDITLLETPKKIVSIAAPAEITKLVGTQMANLGLPTTVDVTLENGMVKTLPVTWDATTYDASIIGAQKLTGKVELPSDGMVTNPDNILAEITVNLIPKDITAITPTPDITKPTGTQAASLGLPTQVEVTLNDGTKTMLDVVWDTAAYNPATVGTQTINGTVTLPTDGTITNSKNLTAKVNIILTPKNITAVTPIADITKAVGTAATNLGLATEVEVTLNDGSKMMLPVSWDTTTYDSSKAGTQTFSGTVILPTDGTITNSAGLKSTVNVTLSAKDITAVTAVADITKLVGTAMNSLGLPVEVEVTLNDGTKMMLPAVFDGSTYNQDLLGAQTLNGTIKLPADGSVSNSKNLGIKIVVNLTSRDITAVSSVTDITKTTGTAVSDLGLPTEVEVTLNDGSKMMLPIEFDSTSYNPNAVGTQTLTGTIKLPADGTVANTGNKTVLVNVILTPKNITAATKPSDITKPVGTAVDALGLPQEVEVTLNDGTKTMLPVVFDTSVYDSSKLGTQTLTGKITLPSGGTITNTSNITSSVNVILTATVNTITSVTPVSPITVVEGTPFESLNLPTEIAVTLDNGKVVNLPIIWDASAYIPEKTGSQVIPARIVLPADGSITDPANTVVNVTVNVNPAPKLDITAVDSIPEISATVGTDITKIALPTTVTVTLSDGTKKELPVTWDTSAINTNAVGTTTLTGNIVLPSTGEIINTGNITASGIIKLVPKFIVKIEALPEIYKILGTIEQNLGLPTTVKATLNDGTVIDIPVKWTGYDSTKLGAQTLNGELVLGDNTIVNSDNVIPTIIVNLAAPVSEIASQTIIAPVTYPIGTPETSLNLPTKVEVVLKDGGKALVDVKWNTTTYNPNLKGEQVIAGEFILPANMTNPDGITPKFTVILSNEMLPPVIDATDQVIKEGTVIDPIAFVTVRDADGNDVTSESTINITGTVDTSTPGTYKVTVTATYNGKTTTKEINFTVKGLPKINGAGNISIVAGSVFDPMLGVTGYDAEDGALIPVVESNNVDTTTPGVYEVVYSVTDKDGEVTRLVRTVTVTETTTVPEVKPVVLIDPITNIKVTGTTETLDENWKLVVILIGKDNYGSTYKNYSYEIKIMNGTEVVQPRGNVEVSIPYLDLDPSILETYYDATPMDTTLPIGEKLASTVDTTLKTVTFTTTHFSAYVIANPVKEVVVTPEPTPNPGDNTQEPVTDVGIVNPNPTPNKPVYNAEKEGEKLPYTGAKDNIFLVMLGFILLLTARKVSKTSEDK